MILHGYVNLPRGCEPMPQFTRVSNRCPSALVKRLWLHTHICWRVINPFVYIHIYIYIYILGDSTLFKDVKWKIMDSMGLSVDSNLYTQCKDSQYGMLISTMAHTNPHFPIGISKSSVTFPDFIVLQGKLGL